MSSRSLYGHVSILILEGNGLDHDVARARNVISLSHSLHLKPDARYWVATVSVACHSSSQLALRGLGVSVEHG